MAKKQSYNLSTAMRNRRQPPYRYGRRLGRLVDFKVGDVNMPMGIGRTSVATRGSRRLTAPMLVNDEYAHHQTEYITGSERLESDAPASTRQYAETITNGDAITNRTLQVLPFVWPAAGTSVGDRLGSTICVSGISLCEQFVNVNSFPCVVHYCLVQPRSTDLTGVWDAKTDFFRNAASSTVRAENFEDTASDPVTSPYSFLYDCYPLNPNKWNILAHKRHTLSGQNDSVNWRWNTWKFNQYIPMKGKRLTFRAETDTQPTQPIFRVFWWQPLKKNDWDAAPDLTALNIVRSADGKVYFRNAFS